MLIIWRGAGAAVFILGILAALFTNIVTSKLFDENNYFQTHSWAQAVALWLTGGRLLVPGPVLTQQTGPGGNR